MSRREEFIREIVMDWRGKVALADDHVHVYGLSDLLRFNWLGKNDAASEPPAGD